jgi:putative ABC transport system permease protein
MFLTGIPRMDTLLQDARAAARSLVQSPWFSITVVVTLAIAIGANTLVFSVVDGVLLGRLPFGAADRLVAITSTSEPAGDGSTVVSAPDFTDWRVQVHRLDGLAAYAQETANLTEASGPARVSAADVSANWFKLLGVPMQLGRGFATGEDAATAPHVVIVSDGFWRSHLGADRSVTGRLIKLDGRPYTVIGVAPPRFTFPGRPDVWLPLVIPPEMLARRGDHYLAVIGRVASGATFAGARDELVTVTERLRSQYMDADAPWHYSLVPLGDQMVKDARTALLVLLAAVGCVLLIACANVANFVLVRTSGRASELGVRMALGAPRRRIVRQLVTESLLLALAGAAGGVALAYGGIHLLVAIRPGNLPRLDDVSLSRRVLLFTSVIAVSAGVLSGFAPALAASAPDIIQSLKSGTRGLGHRRTGRMRRVLVIAENALAVMLLVGAGLLTRSFLRLVTVDPGFRAEEVVRLSVSLPDNGYGTWEKIAGLTQGVVGRLQRLPGTAAAAAGYGVPFGQEGISQTVFTVAGRPPDPPEHRMSAILQIVTPDFFRTLRIPVRKGRAFTDGDRAGGHLVVVVNEALVRKYFPGEDPVGHRIAIPWGTAAGRDTVMGGDIVGVVGDTKTTDLTTPADPVVYAAFDQQPADPITFIVRSAADPSTVVAAAKQAVAEADPLLPVYDARPFAASVLESVSRPQLYAGVVGAFAVVALVLAVLGIYGVVAYTVRDRRRELGIRMALGAREGQVIGLVVSQGVRLAVIGLAIGFAGALLGGRLLSAMLFGVSADDLTTYEIVFVALMAVSVMAAWLPARRAATIDPVIAMRPE